MRNNFCPVVRFLGCGALLLCGAAFAADVIKAPATDGGQLQFDGVYYDYRDAKARKAIKMWVPPGDQPIRGILFHGNPGGGGGDTRNLARDANLQEFAARYRLAIVGVTWFPGGRVYNETGQAILQAFEDWAKLGRHPEIANLPIIARGSSNAGVTAYSLACLAPQRMLCFTPNVGPRYTPASPPDAVLGVPALMHIGPKDPFFPAGVDATARLFADARSRGALWAWDAEQNKGHEIRHIDDVDLKFYETCIALRLPADADARKGPVTLRKLRAENGWLVDLGSWESGITTIAPYAEFKGDKSKAGWVPTKDIAYLYRAISSYNNPITLRCRDLGPVGNPNASGSLLRSIGGNVVDPGTRIVLEADATGLSDWQRIEFYHGAELIGQVARGQKPTCEFVVESRHTVYALCAVATDGKGDLRTSYPVHFIVRDPKISATLAAQRQGLEPPPHHAPAVAAGSGAGVASSSAPADPADSVLIAYGLSAEQERQFAATPNRLSAFWGQFTDRHDRAVLTMGKHLAGGGAPGKEGDIRVIVKAAHTRAGLYLCLETIDDEWAPAVGLDDALDVHIARDSSKAIWSAKSLNDMFLAIQYSLVLSEVQYQAAYGTMEQPGTLFCRNIPSPWDMQREERTLEQARLRSGIVVRQIVLAKDRRAMEWFIPWDQVGSGGAMVEPAAGTRLGLALGYNDRDPSRHKPDQMDKIRWPDAGGPWAHAADQGPTPNPWGDVETGPMLESVR